MKIQIITNGVHSVNKYRSVNRLVFPILSLTGITIAVYIPNSFKHKIIVRDLDHPKHSLEFDLVMISSLTYSTPKAYKIGDYFLKEKVPVIIGGHHASAMPEEAKKHADSVVIGPARKNTIHKIIKDLESKLQDRYFAHELDKNYDSDCFPRRDLLPHRSFIDQITTSYGCSMGCNYCCVPTYYNGKYRSRSINTVIQEMKSIGKYVVINDNNFSANTKRTKVLLERMMEEQLGKKWVAGATLSGVTKDPNLLELMRESGCVGIFVGFESLSYETVKKLGRTDKSVRHYREQVKKIHDTGIAVEGSFIVGFDEDDKSVFERISDFCYETKIDMPFFSILTPYPGTRLFAELKKRIFRKDYPSDWVYYDQSHVVFEPKKMTQEQLDEGFKKLWQETYSLGSIIHRLFTEGVTPQPLLSIPVNLGYGLSVKMSK